MFMKLLTDKVKKTLGGLVFAASISSTALCGESEDPGLKFWKYCSVGTYFASCGYFFKKENDKYYKKDQ